jgi:hypothetical protein
MCLLSGFAIGFASFSGFRFRSQHHLSGVVVLALAVLFMSFSMHNGIRYVGGQSVAKARLTEARRQQSVDLATLKNQQAIEGRAWLRRTYTQTKDKAEKDKLLAQAVAPIELTAANIEAEMPDGGASVLAAIFGVDEATVEMASAVAFPILLVIGKVLGPLIGFAFWPIRKSEISMAGNAGGNRNIGNAGNSSGEIIQFPAVSAVSTGKQRVQSITSPVSISDGVANDDAVETPVSKGQKDEFPRLSMVSNGGPAPSKETVSKVSTGRKMTRQEALIDLRKLIAQQREIPSQKALSKRWDIPPGTVSKWCARWERCGEIARRKNGSFQEVVAGISSFHAPGRA